MGVRFPYVVYVPMQNLRNVFRSRAWCQKQFGKQFDALDNRTGSWCYFWAGVERMREYEYRFAREQDAVLFTLRWVQ